MIDGTLPEREETQSPAPSPASRRRINRQPSKQQQVWGSTFHPGLGAGARRVSVSDVTAHDSPKEQNPPSTFEVDYSTREARKTATEQGAASTTK